MCLETYLGPTPGVGWQPTPHRQCLEKLCFSWYALAEGDRAYRPVPVEVALGPDLALPLRPVWDQVEAHAERLDRLARDRIKRLRGSALHPRPTIAFRNGNARGCS